MANEATIRERLEASRKELLDLTYKNRLLNFKELRARGSTLEAWQPDPQ